MYTNIFYDYKQNNIHLWEKTNGKTEYSCHEYKPSLYRYANNTEVSTAVDIYGKKLIKMDFVKESFCRKFCEDNFLTTAGYNSPVSKFLTERYSPVSHKPEFFGIELNLLYFDIETYSPNGVPDKDLAPDAIVSIGTYNNVKKEYACFAINASVTGTTVSRAPGKLFIQCGSEKDLLESFINYINTVKPDILVQFNGLQFDIPIVINRCIRLLGQEKTNELSPVRIIQHTPKSETCSWRIAGMAFLDYMELVKKFKKGEYPSYSLANISKQLLNRPKLPTVFATECMDANFNITNEPVWKEFLKYMMRDVECLVEFEEKLKYIKISQMIYMQGLCEPEQIYGTINYVDGAILAEIYRMGMIPPNKVIVERPTPGKYPGGWVKEPIKGISDWVVTYDINSLYPMSMVSLNISPETKICKVQDAGVKDSNDEWSFPIVDKIRNTINGDNESEKESISVAYGKTSKIIDITVGEIAEHIKNNKLIISPCGTVYNSMEGIIPKVLKKWFAERKNTQATMGKLKESKGDANLIKFYDDIQFSAKVRLNSTYGALGSKFSIFYDIDNAVSVTTTGQNIIKSAESSAKEYFKETYGIVKTPVIYIDTDSLFITYIDYLKSISIKPDDTENAMNMISKESDDLKEYLNNAYQAFCEKYFNISKHYFVFKKEIIADNVLFLEKKHYILHMLENDGMPVSEEKSLKAKGVELVTSTTPEKIKPLLSDIIKHVLKGNTAKVVEIIKNGKNTVDGMSIENIARSGGIKNIEKFILPSETIQTEKGEITLPRWKKGSPVHVKSAICYNFLTKDMRVKYDEIKSNMKMKYVYLLPNKYGWDAIGFVEKFPEEFDLKVDFSKMYSKLVMSMVEKIFEVLGWSVPNMRSINLMSIFQEENSK